MYPIIPEILDVYGEVGIGNSYNSGTGETNKIALATTVLSLGLLF